MIEGNNLVYAYVNLSASGGYLGEPCWESYVIVFFKKIIGPLSYFFIDVSNKKKVLQHFLRVINVELNLFCSYLFHEFELPI